MSSAFCDTPTPQEMTSIENGVMAMAPALRDECSSAHTQLLMTMDVQPEIKSEPPMDIDDDTDRHRPLELLEQAEIKSEPMFMGFDDRQFENSNSNSNDYSPKIRLTPTSKLLATPNPVDPKRKFACPYDNCTKSYGKSSHLRSHLTWHTGVKPFVCQEPTCGKGFTRSDELNRHVRTHTGEKPFECVQCTKKFSRSDHLTKHLATHAKQMVNPTTPKRVRTPGDPSSVKKAVRKMKNEHQHLELTEGMHFMAALVESAAQIKTENLTDEQQPNENDPLQMKFHRPAANSDEYQVVSALQTLAQHRHITASESEDEIPPELIVPLSTMICPDSPEIQEDVKQEIKEEIDEEIEREIKEELEEEPPIDQNDRLNDDDMIMPEANALLTPPGENCASIGAPPPPQTDAEVAYEAERPFRCSQCSKRFKRQDDLNRHLRTHTGEKPFSCTECDKRFMRSDHLKKHMNLHTKLRRTDGRCIYKDYPQQQQQQQGSETAGI